ncbi:MAG TPA: hypothetical protein VF753_10320 [Terriglobales bacterium]
MKQTIVIVHMLAVCFVVQGNSQLIQRRTPVGVKVEAERGLRIQPTINIPAKEIETLTAQVSNEASSLELYVKLVTLDYPEDHINVRVIVARTGNGLYVASSVTTLYFAQSQEDKFLVQDVLVSSDVTDLAKAICSEIHGAAGLAESEGVE